MEGVTTNSTSDSSKSPEASNRGASERARLLEEITELKAQLMKSRAAAQAAADNSEEFNADLTRTPVPQVSRSHISCINKTRLNVS